MQALLQPPGLPTLLYRECPKDQDRPRPKPPRERPSGSELDLQGPHSANSANAPNASSGMGSCAGERGTRSRPIIPPPSNPSRDINARVSTDRAVCTSVTGL